MLGSTKMKVFFSKGEQKKKNVTLFLKGYQKIGELTDLNEIFNAY